METVFKILTSVRFPTSQISATLKDLLPALLHTLCNFQLLTHRMELCTAGKAFLNGYVYLSTPLTTLLAIRLFWLECCSQTGLGIRPVLGLRSDLIGPRGRNAGETSIKDRGEMLQDPRISRRQVGSSPRAPWRSELTPGLFPALGNYGENFRIWPEQIHGLRNSKTAAGV